MGMKKGALVSSVATVALCASMIAGSTWALFTQETRTDIVVSSANVSVVADIPDGSLDLINDVDNSGTFPNGGTARIEGNNLILENITPGDGVSFKINLANTSNIPLTYSVNLVRPSLSANPTEEEQKQSELAKALHVTMKRESEDGEKIETGTEFDLNPDKTSVTVWVEVKFLTAAERKTLNLPEVDYNLLQGVEDSKISIIVNATQKNAD